MKTTKKCPVIVRVSYPGGTVVESRVPLWKAYAIASELEKEKFKNEEL